jgi:NADH pyrophosphatase NudC (nudix superfamily)
MDNIMKYCLECGSALVAKHIDGNTRYVCSSKNCDFIYWNNPIPVVAALVSCNGKYIIARNSAWPKGIFSVITGYLEREESPEDAVVREVTEELGVKGTIKRHIGNYGFHEKNQVILCYEVEATGKIEINHEIVEFIELSPRELLEYDFSPLYITELIKRDWSIYHTKSTQQEGDRYRQHLI